jgi:hypothetical protein
LDKQTEKRAEQAKRDKAIANTPAAKAAGSDESGRDVSTIAA